MQTMGAKAPMKDYGFHSCTEGHETGRSGQIKDPWVHLQVYGCSMEIGLKSRVPKNRQTFLAASNLWPIQICYIYIYIYHVRTGHPRFRKQIWVQILFLICGGPGLDVLILKEIHL